MENRYGAFVERGRITASEGGKFRVKSFDRDGVNTPALAALPMPEEEETPLTVGDAVFFCVFGDGSGIILGRFEVN